MLTTRSLRSNLALSYAGIALLTTAVLGTVLLSVLGSYYARSEDAYLQAAAERLVADPPRSSDAIGLSTWAQLAALSTQTRVRVYDAEGEVVADSGSPRDVDTGSLVPRDEDGRGPRDRERLPSPLGEGIFGDSSGDEGDVRSSRTLTLELSGAIDGRVEVSEAPASGSGVLLGVAQAWLVAAALAVALAALVGYLVSRRISRPIVELTEASDRMAEGDLSARAPVSRNDEVGQLGESFNAMASRIEGTVTTLRRFVADAAHEIGTPLTALQADLELAEQAARSEDEQRLVDRALGQARRLETLSANLLALSRIEAGDVARDPANTDAGIAVAEIVESFASRAEQAEVDLSLEAASGSLAAVSRAELATIVGNLLDNALKFTPAGGSVTVSVRERGGVVAIGVNDTGVGIPEAEHAEVFSRFHRGRNVAAYPGNGLGLAIVRATAERAGGSVGFASSTAGTTFTVLLPRA